MLGKLFSSAASTLTPRGGSPNTSRPTTSLDSVQEDIHTRNLLYPDADALYQHQHDQVFPLASAAVPLLTSSTSAFDIDPEIDLDLRDVRVVIMQEATGFLNSAALLFDSHPLLEYSSSSDKQPTAANGNANPSRMVSRGSISSPRRISLGQTSKPVVITQENSAPRNLGAFDRRPSVHTRAASYVETEGQRSAREYREEMTTFSNCIFGSSDIMAYKGTGTKVHIIPTELKSSSYSFGDGHGSLGRSSMRSSRLAQSYTSETIAPAPTSAGLPSTPVSHRLLDKKRVLITRIFPVLLPNTDEEVADGRTPTTKGLDSNSSYPFPSIGDDMRPPEKKPQPKQKRTPMFAIGLIVQLPTTSHLLSAPILRTGFRGPGSFNDQESFPSSFSSIKPAGWTVLGNGFGVDSLDSSFVSEVDDRIDAVTQHWDIIMRTLSQLQDVVSLNVLALLKQADVNSPNPLPKASSSQTRTPTASISVSGKRIGEQVKPPKGSNIKPVQLMPNALINDEKIKTEVDSARQRIVSGIKALQVVTRQGRWGIWREEARWVSKWAGSKEEGFFFYNLLTSFLGTHTEWLQALGPSWYRRRYYQQQRAIRDDEPPISARTVIVALDKMASRRLIFLLSAFLPPNQHQQIPPVRQHRPGTATSFGGYSQSPPSYVFAVQREESLRRRVNKISGHTRNNHSRTMSFPTPELPGGNVQENYERRNSDALKTANLPIPGSDGGSRKSSAATTTTVTPVATIPHFSTRRPIRGTGPVPRPGSRGSLAADDLIRSLKRGDSTGHYSTTSTDSQGHSRWGSMISGFWSTKRRGSTNLTDITPPSLEGLEIDPHTKRDKLADMVDEVTQQKPNQEIPNYNSVTYATAGQPANQEPQGIHPAGVYESPVKTSINADGVIDIDVPLPDFLGPSFGSTVSSPSSSGYLSGLGPGLEGFEHYSRCGPDDDPPLNVGGWVPRFHPDFVLQAIPSSENLEEEIKAAMRTEPTPIINFKSIDHDENSRWVDVSSALIADATKFAIKRIRLRRLVRLRSAMDSQGESISGSYDGRSQTQSLYGNPYSASHLSPSVDTASNVLEECFVEEPVMSMEESLIEAVERIIAQSGVEPRSKHGSGSSTRSTSRIRGSTDETNPPDAKDVSAPLEVPRGECKKTLLSALEEIAMEVADSFQDEPILQEFDPNSSTSPRQESFLREGIRTWLRAVEDGG